MCLTCVGFLFTDVLIIVGHTHEDIDQLFSRIAVALRRGMAPTPAEFAALIELCFSPSPTVVLLHSVANISHAVETTLVKDFPTGIMQYRQFNFWLSPDGVPLFNCRKKPHGNTICSYSCNATCCYYFHF